jgi:transposase
MIDDVRSFETSFESSDLGKARRMEVLPTGAGRRRWSADLKARIVAESFVPGANVAAVARYHAILPQQLYQWRHMARRDQEPLSFVPAVMGDAAAAGPLLPGRGADIVIAAGAMVIHVPEAASCEHIKRVLMATQVLEQALA